MVKTTPRGDQVTHYGQTPTADTQPILHSRTGRGWEEKPFAHHRRTAGVIRGRSLSFLELCFSSQSKTCRSGGDAGKMWQKEHLLPDK